jgi:alkylation response protein AidB-like acyl-CoA dehydrogenase
MNLGLSEDQLAIEDAFTRLFVRESPPAVVRAAEPLGFDHGLWQRLVEMGAPGMGVAAESGGGEATLSDLVVVAETLGHAIAPVPLIEHMVAARAHPVDDVVEGATIATISLRPAGPDGTWRLVPAGAIADVVIGVDGDELVAVRSPAPGEAPRNHAAAPIADRSARVGERTVLGPAGDFARSLGEWKALTSGALVGISAAALQLGRDYAMSRYQFGVPIGSFQAVQHGLADLPALIDGARLLTHKAAWSGDQPAPGTCNVDDADITDFDCLAGMAFVFAAETATRSTDRSLHFHGGYGFSVEYDIQLYYRRARGWALVFDDPSRECLRLADGLFGPVTAGAA